MSWYAQLDLALYGGDPGQGWAMLRNRAIEIHLFQGHIPKDLLNFRGGDLDEIRAALTERGLEIASEQGDKSYILLDPDEREVFFDSSPPETEAYAAGQPLTGPIPGDDVHVGEGLDLGNLTWCLRCEDLRATTAFYETLGLVSCGGSPETGKTILGRADHRPVLGTRVLGTTLSLFQGRIPMDTLNLRGGNVGSIAETLTGRGVDLRDGVQEAPDGGESLLLLDPDGRPVFLDTTPPERLYRV